MTLTHVPVPVDRDRDPMSAGSTLTIHRPRWRRWWPAAVAAFVVLVLVAVAFTQVTAPALAFDGTPSLWRAAPGDHSDIRLVENALGSEITVGFERSGTFTAELALVNHGRYPVKILGFPHRGAYYYGLERVEMATDAGGPRQEFRSFTLRRGAARWLVLHFRFADCDLQRGETPPAARKSLPISYRVFGLHQRQSVPFSRFAMSVPTGRCDRPIV
ncbi:MAG TPA: hypothetical protein VEG38_09135 [Acidimicrobiia bacterium]|nr:hypothetical protein [Acidimicrobiia bacterium]